MISPVIPRFAAGLGFNQGDKGAEELFVPSAVLALTLAALPVLLQLPVDIDRTLPLAFAPAVVTGWKHLRSASRIDLVLVGWALIAMLASAAFSDHAARAFVMTSAVVWTLAGAVAAHSLAGCEPAVRLVLSGIVAGAVAGTVMLRLGVDAPSATFPIYGNSRLFGAHQFSGCAAALGLLVYPIRRRSAWLLLATASAIVWTGLFWSGGRAPLVAAAVLAGCWFWKSEHAHRRMLMAWIPALVLAGLACSWLLRAPYPGMGSFSAVTRTVQASGIEQISSDRSRFWTETWRYAREAPWLGHGADGYRFIVPNQNGSQPHNMLLQWFVEYGLFGLVPLTVLLLRGMRGLFGPASVRHRRWAAASLAGAAAYGLLDGIFYHACAFMPVAVLAGLALGTAPESDPVSIRRGREVFRPLLMGAMLVMILHFWLQTMLLHARNVTPDSAPARILRAFPSTTVGLQNWIESWRKTQPELAMKWIRWAQEASSESASFHLYAAQLLIWQKNYKAAETELLSCLAKVHYLERPDVQIAIDTVRALDAGKTIPQRAPTP